MYVYQLDSAAPSRRDLPLARTLGGRAIEVPGLRALNTGGLAEVTSVSRGSAGNCAAGGDYQDRHGGQGFVAVERRGRYARNSRISVSRASHIASSLSSPN